MATILTKRSNTASSVPLAADLTNSTSGAELAVNTADKRLFTKDSGGSVVELGTNPSSLTLTGGTANGVAYLNGSKVLTSGSALTFDGTNLGLGTASVGALGSSIPTLELKGGITTRTGGLRLRSSDNSVDGYFYADSAGFFIGSGSATDVRFGIGGSEAMRLTSTGLGIGTSSPSYPLVVKGSNAIAQLENAAGTSSLRLQISESGYGIISMPSAYSLTFRTNNTERARIDSSGNLLVGTTSGSYKVEVAGDVNITGSYRVNGTAFSGLTGGQTGSAPLYGARAWVNFNGTGTVAIRASGNVSSITDNGTGDYTVNFTTAMPDANYAFSALCGYNTGITESAFVTINTSVVPTTSAYRFKTRDGAGTVFDSTYVLSSVFR
jgi:hypothetical protein